MMLNNFGSIGLLLSYCIHHFVLKLSTMQMNELADIARCVANASMDDERSMQYLLTCLEDLKVVVDRRKFDSLTVETFGTRIEKLIRSFRDL